MLKRLPRLSSFTIIGVILIVIGILGLVHGPSFQYDAGVKQSGLEGFYYLFAGVMMILNGYYSLPPQPVEVARPKSAVSRTTTTSAQAKK